MELAVSRDQATALSSLGNRTRLRLKKKKKKRKEKKREEKKEKERKGKEKKRHSTSVLDCFCIAIKKYLRLGNL